MKFNKILIVGCGQIGRAILKRVYEFNPEMVHIHNLTKEENEKIKLRSDLISGDIKYSFSSGNIFMPYSLKDLNNNDLVSKKNEIIAYFYQDLNENVLKKSTIYTLVEKFKPDLIIDAVNTATVLGKAYNPCETQWLYKSDIKNCCENVLVNDFTTKIINFVSGLKLAMETFRVQKYIKVSTTGLGGMGFNMPYTHGDNPTYNLSNALMGKISASGVLHQLLWNLQHTKGLDISVVVPGTFVGVDSVMKDDVDNDFGFVKKRLKIYPKTIEFGKEMMYNDCEVGDVLKFEVVRAGENHVYSMPELATLTALGQMEAITKEEVADAVIKDIIGQTKSSIFEAMNKNMLKPTYLGRDMVKRILSNNKVNRDNGIATGNLGVTTAKHLYELYLIKKIIPTLKSALSDDLDISTITEKVNMVLVKDQNLIDEIVSLGIAIITNNNQLYVGDYTLAPSKLERKILTEENVNKWAEIGWVDLRGKNIEYWITQIKDVWKKRLDFKNIDNINYLNNNLISLCDDYDIGEILAMIYNFQNKGREK